MLFKKIVSLIVTACLFLGTAGPTLSVHYCSTSNTLNYSLSLIQSHSNTKQDACAINSVSSSDETTVLKCCAVNEKNENNFTPNCCSDDNYSFQIKDEFQNVQTTTLKIKNQELMFSYMTLKIFPNLLITKKVFDTPENPPNLESHNLRVKNMIWLI
jgi:hypothetical protein